MLRLVIEDDEGKTTVVPLIRDEITIGRKDGNTIRLTEWNVSRRHARLLRTGDNGRPTVLLEDLDSYNGVRLNGDRIHGRCTVQPGDLIQIGDYSLALRVDSPEGEAKEASPSTPGRDGGNYQAELLPSDEHARLVVVSSNLAGDTFHIDRREVIVGRIQENDMVVNHRSISRNHAKIIVQNGSFTIVDLHSSNGVRVNGDDYGTATLINGDIIELGHVKLRFCAPGDDYIFTRADINDVEVEPDASTFKLVIIALLLVGIAIGTFFIVRQLNQPHRAGPHGVQAPVPASNQAGKPINIDEVLVEGKEFIALKEWPQAILAFERILQAKPEHEEARGLKAKAKAEAENKKRAEEINKELEARRWADAEFLISEFPKDSAYTAEVESKRVEMERGYIDSELTRARAYLERGDVREAEHIQEALALKSYAKAEAKRLDGEIKSHKRANEPKKPRRGKKPVKKKPSVEPEAEPATPSAPAPAAPVGDYDDLMKDAMNLFIAGQRLPAARLFERAHAIKPSAIAPNKRLCAIYGTVGRKERAIYHCTLHWKKEQDPTTKANLKRRLEELKR